MLVIFLKLFYVRCSGLYTAPTTQLFKTKKKFCEYMHTELAITTFCQDYSIAFSYHSYCACYFVRTSCGTYSFKSTLNGNFWDVFNNCIFFFLINFFPSVLVFLVFLKTIFNFFFCSIYWISFLIFQSDLHEIL